jgi:type IV secretory pathway VirB3-like protein
MEMERTTVFIGLTRPVSMAGLPINYIVVLMGVVMLGFILTSSFQYVLITAPLGYVILRVLAAYDPKIIDVFFAVMGSTPMDPGLFREEGVTYRA